MSPRGSSKDELSKTDCGGTKKKKRTTFSYTCLAIALQTPNGTALLATVHRGKDSHPISCVAKYNKGFPDAGRAAPFRLSGYVSMCVLDGRLKQLQLAPARLIAGCTPVVHSVIRAPGLDTLSPRALRGRDP